ncbi:tyrosine-type recombinase/integrase [Mycolicibacterium houstonense]|uniref:tyrosine-type recombinase/integrase n=1 Tax=Mycolicibacterium houstonense TaxID=146021 RepID=UPI0008357990|nr:site-specific integrase [Mycolicibacterium houstonense]
MAATIRKRTTGKLDKRGNPLVSYQVRWREPVRDSFGVPSIDDQGRQKFRQTSETFDTERKAKAHARKVDNALESSHIDPSTAKAKANLPLGHYAKQYLDSLVGSLDDSTIEGYEKIYRTHLAPVFGSKPVASITSADVASFRANLLAPHEYHQHVSRRVGEQSPRTVVRSAGTVKHIIGTLKRILDTAQDDQAIPANPVISGRRQRTTKRRVSSDGKAPFKHHPLTANQVAAVHDWIASDHIVTRTAENSSGPKGSTYTREGNGIYALAVLFAAHTGVRASELQGLQVQDITLPAAVDKGQVATVRISRTAKRKGREWIYGTPKSEASTDRVVPLAPWLAEELRQYLDIVHPFAGQVRDGKGKTHYIAHAPLFPGRGNRYTFDWAHPVHAGNLYENYLAPACQALGIDKAVGGTVRFHDLRHTFATMNLSAGEHYMQVSKWLGHSTYVLTLSVYADYITEEQVVVPKVGRGSSGSAAGALPSNVVPLRRKAN